MEFLKKEDLIDTVGLVLCTCSGDNGGVEFARLSPISHLHIYPAYSVGSWHRC